MKKYLKGHPQMTSHSLGLFRVGKSFLLFTLDVIVIFNIWLVVGDPQNRVNHDLIYNIQVWATQKRLSSAQKNHCFKWLIMTSLIAFLNSALFQTTGHFYSEYSRVSALRTAFNIHSKRIFNRFLNFFGHLFNCSCICVNTAFRPATRER